ncbi:hypothetical protein [Aquibium oceanicum]|uniref:hypothetical protein n=1 Tax=Aquibium oceanicum TaxID=1670800 RepID=UPI000AA39992|nr:hypothetical protein [Aquibium oceanicum]
MNRVWSRASWGTALLGFFLFSAAAQAGQVNVKAGSEVGLLNFALFESYKCKPIKAVIKVVVAPKHGTLRQVRANLDPADADSADYYDALCSGTKLQSIMFLYKANAGYKGRDRVVLRALASTDGSGDYSFDIIVE